jgi:putative nucleotidyltransferase with HDIG domain
MNEEKKIRKYLEKQLPDHVVDHCRRVAVIAQNLAEEEGANEEVAYAAGLLHDIGYSKGFENHAQSGAGLARKFLEKEGLYPAECEEIIMAVATHQLQPEPASLEGWIVSDADIIERIGPVGIHRMYIAGLYWLKLPPEELLEVLDQALESTEDLHTPTAKRYAHKDIAYLKAYIERLEEDLATEE